MVADPAQGAIAEVSVEDAWSRLASDPGAVLIDVRTKAEWAFVGVPDLDKIGKKPILIEWHGFPDNRVHGDFAERLAEALDGIGAGKDAELLFLCRSGGRSLMAARIMSAAGFTRCRNVTHGFEGSLDAMRHRGRQGGWKARDLPWIQG
ncbi:MAG: rhodanese-like domain-containing protein [Usitatibacteraceae bacterium]